MSHSEKTARGWRVAATFQNDISEETVGIFLNEMQGELVAGELELTKWEAAEILGCWSAGGQHVW